MAGLSYATVAKNSPALQQAPNLPLPAI